MKVIGNLTKDAIIRAAVSEGITVTQEIGSSVTFESAATQQQTVIYDSTNQKIVIGYRDQGNSNYGTAVVGTVSGSSISFGTPVVFESSTTGYMSGAFDSNNGKVVFCFRGASNYGRAVVGTVSGTSISFGSVANFESATIESTGTAYDANAQRIVVAYRDDGNSYHGTAAVGTVSGTSISFGTPVVFQASASYYFAPVYDASAQKVVIGYRDDASSSAGTAIVGTVSGTSISFGTKQAFESGNTVYISGDYDSVNQKVVFAYQDSGNSSYGTAVVGTVSGTSISFGTPVVFNEGNSTYFSTTFDSGAGRFLISYSDDSNSSKGEAIVGTVSGTSISFGDMALFKNASADFVSSAYDANSGRVVIGFRSPSNSNYGEAVVFKLGYSQATGGTIADGKAVIVNANGTVSTISTSTASLGSVTQFESGGIIYGDITYDTTNDKVVIVYRDKGNSNYGTAVVGTVSGESISFGTPVVYNSSSSAWNACAFDENAGKVGIFYLDLSVTRGKSVVGTVSGTSISFGSEAEFAALQASDIDAVYNSTAQKIVLSYKNNSNNYANAIVGTISGTSISFGSSASISGSSTMSSYTSIGYDSTNDKVVACYGGTSGGYPGMAAVGTVSGTSISFGTPVQFTAGAFALGEVVFDSSNDKINIFYSNGGNSDYIEGVIGTVSGTSISFTSGQTLYNAAGAGTAMCAVYNPKSVSSIIVFRGASAYGLVMPVTSSGTSFTAGSISTITTNAIGMTEAVYDPDQEKVVAALQDGDDSDKGKAVVYTAAASTLTTENFVGFMDGAALDGTNGEILSSCSIARNQTSLTAGQTYFVSPTDGSLSLTAGSPSVTAGTAISTTELIVKG